MRWQLVFAGYVTYIQAFAPAPIVWGRLPAQRFVLAPRSFPNMGAVSPGSAASPQELKIWDQQGFGRRSPDEIPSFMPQPDKTISSVTMGSKVCLEASGSSVRVNRCIGGPTQAWTILPWMHGKSQIHLQDTNKCIFVEDEGDLNGAPVELRECENKMTELWTLGDPFSLPTQIPSQRSVPPLSARLAFMYFISMAAFGILSLTAWLWRRREKLRVLPVSRGCIPLDMEQGSICLAVPLAAFQGGAPCNASSSTIVPAVMAVSPDDNTVDADNATVEQEKEAFFGVAAEDAAPGPQQLFKGINAVTLATSDMGASYQFYSSLGLRCTYGGSTANFTTFGSSGGPSGGDNSFHVNLFVSTSFQPPPKGRWNGWGRAILYVQNVDAVYNAIVQGGLQPEAKPMNAPWGERYFHILDPMGHEMAIAQPLSTIDQVSD